MDNLKADIKVLGEKNAERLKSSIVDIIIENISNDFESYDSYLLDPDDVAEFIEECKKEAFNRICEEAYRDYVDDTGDNIELEDLF